MNSLPPLFVLLCHEGLLLFYQLASGSSFSLSLKMKYSPEGHTLRTILNINILFQIRLLGFLKAVPNNLIPFYLSYQQL